MKVSEALIHRRSIKAFDPTVEIPEEEIRSLIDLALETPSSFNMQHWRLALVTETAQKERLCEAAWHQKHIREASLVVLIAGNLEAHENPERYWAKAPGEVAAKMANLIRGFYRDPQMQRDEAIRSCSLLGMSLMLAATERGWDSCPMIGFDPKKVAEILEMPPQWLPALMVTIGKGIKEAYPKPGALPFEEVVFRNRFKESDK